jgi:plastocyanin
VEGADVRSVASYVAFVAAKKGKDTGALATAVKAPGAGKPIDEKNGKLDIPADPNGQLAYLSDKANAKPGAVEISMVNKSSSQHDIVLEGSGVKEEGEVVGQGGTSKISATLKAGKYTYYCSVPGHREGGMQGTITVK